MKKIIKKGFTLLELLIVIVILGLLVSLVSVNFLPTLSNAYTEVARQDISRPVSYTHLTLPTILLV